MKPNILCIEDNDDDLFLLKECLSDYAGDSAPYDLKACTTIQAAEKILKETDVDVILLDLFLPDSEGLSSFSRIHAEFPSIPVVILSSLDDEQVANEAVRQGAQDYLVKGTINPWLMSRILRYASERHRIYQKLNEANSKLEQLALNDPLTGLLNRRGLENYLNKDMTRFERNSGVVSVILIDMDNFKLINDTHGHAAGDAVLKEVATRTATLLRSDDQASRVGGDEFMVILPDTRLAEARLIAEKIRQSFAHSTIRLSSGAELSFTASLGVVALPFTRGLTIDTLLTVTHDTLYRSKKDGRNRVSCDGETPVASTNGHALDFPAYIRRLKNTGAFYAVSQPIFSFHQMQPVGYEFYTRCKNQEIGSPDDLFRLCQENKILEEVDNFCFDMCIKASERIAGKNITRHVNLFPTTLLSAEFHEKLSAAANPKKGPVCIEISDQQILGEPYYLVEGIKTLKRKGFLFALDDIGFGRSYLESVILLEPDIIKIDQRCIKGISQDPALVRMVQRMLKMMESLKIRVIFEGIENKEDLTTLRDLGVQFGQGYEIGAPA